MSYDKLEKIINESFEKKTQAFIVFANWRLHMSGRKFFYKTET